MLTHIICHIFRTARTTNFKLGIQMEDDVLHQPQAPSPPRSKVRVARSRDQSELSSPNAVPVSSEGGGCILCRPNPAATLFVSEGSNSVVMFWERMGVVEWRNMWIMGCWASAWGGKEVADRDLKSLHSVGRLWFIVDGRTNEGWLGRWWWL